MMNFKPSGRVKWMAVAAALLWLGVRLTLLLVVDLNALHGWAEGLNPVLLLAASALLPVLGFPTSVLHVIVGAKFGPTVGVLLTAVTVLINLVCIYWVGGALLAKPVAAFLRRTKFRVPEMPNRDLGWVALLTALLPGPYTVKNYLLSVAKVPLRKNLVAGWPVYVLRCSSVILFGGFANQLTPGRIAFLLAYGTIVALLCRFVIKRVQASLVPVPVPVTV